jgi:hypothetical protein
MSYLGEACPYDHVFWAKIVQKCLMDINEVRCLRERANSTQRVHLRLGHAAFLQVDTRRGSKSAGVRPVANALMSHCAAFV